MYISRVVLHTHLQKKELKLENRNIPHGIVESCIPPRVLPYDPEVGRPLFLLKEEEDRPVLYMTTPHKPRFDHLIGQSVESREDITVIPYKHVIHGIREKSVVRLKIKFAFRRNKKGRQVPVKKMQYVYPWIAERASQHGFTFLDEFTTLKLEGREAYQKWFHKVPQVIWGIMFDAPVYIEDAAKFQYMMKHGMGEYKAYGFGMPAVSPVDAATKQQVRITRDEELLEGRSLLAA